MCPPCKVHGELMGGLSCPMHCIESIIGQGDGEVCQLELVSNNSALSRNALVSLVVPSQAHKLPKLLVSKSVEAPPTCRAGALPTECRHRTRHCSMFVKPQHTPLRELVLHKVLICSLRLLIECTHVPHVTAP